MAAVRLPSRRPQAPTPPTFLGPRRGRRAMPKYLIQATYTPEGLKGLHKDKASGRRTAVMNALEPLRGKLESMYYAFGQDDVIAILDLPDNVSASAVSLAISASGLVR